MQVLYKNRCPYLLSHLSRPHLSFFKKKHLSFRIVSEPKKEQNRFQIDIVPSVSKEKNKTKQKLLGITQVIDYFKTKSETRGWHMIFYSS